MPKVNVIIETSEDGHPLWDEASVKRIPIEVRAGHKPNHHEGRETNIVDHPHYSGRNRETNADSALDVN